VTKATLHFKISTPSMASRCACVPCMAFCGPTLWPTSPKARQPRHAIAQDEHRWLHDVFAIAWPQIDKWLHRKVTEELAPAINSALPSMVKGRVLVKAATIGKATPNFGPVITRERGCGDVVIDIGIDLRSELKLSLEALGISVGIQDLVLTGTLSVVLAPPASRPPFFGAVEVYCVNPPELDFHLTGAGHVAAQLPRIKRILRDAVASIVNKTMVLPARIAADIHEDDKDFVDLRFPAPLGIMRLTLLQGHGLRAADFSMVHMPTSDPYVKVEIGQTVWTSSIIQHTLEPVWSEGNVVDLPVYDLAQSVKLSAWDSDVNTADDLLGESERLAISEFFGPGKANISMPLFFNGAAAGSLTVSTAWLKLGSEKPPCPLKGPSSQLISFKLESVSGLPPSHAAGASPPFTVLVSAGSSASERSHQSHSSLWLPEVAAEVHQICKHMQSSGANDISASTGLDLWKVKYCGLVRTNPAEAERYLETVKENMARETPTFEQIVHLLLPQPTDGACVVLKLELQDKNKQRVGAALEVTLAELLSASNCALSGPFSVAWPDPGKRQSRLLSMSNGISRRLARSSSAGRQRRSESPNGLRQPESPKSVTRSIPNGQAGATPTGCMVWNARLRAQWLQSDS